MAKLVERAAVIMTRQALADLAPFPGRLANTWRIALLAALVAAAAMAYELPDAAVSCYLVVFLMKPDSSESCVVGVAVIVLITVVIALLIPLSQWTADSPPFRFLVISAVSFALLYIGAASKVGEVGGVLALIVAVVLTLQFKAPGGDIISTALRYAWEMIVMPMGIMIAFSLLLGRSTIVLLRDGLRRRLIAAREALELPDPSRHEELRDLLREGNDQPLKRTKFVRLFHFAPSGAAAQIEADVWASYQLMLAVSCLSAKTSRAERTDLAAEIENAIQALDSGTAMPVPAPTATGRSHSELDIRDALAAMAGSASLQHGALPKQPFFKPDALRDPEYQHFALKTTAAAMLCYVIYSSLNWQGIHTAMITCYVASLGTTGETIHKLALRITGCLIGALLGWGSILFLIPQMDSVGQLALLIFAGSFVAAWVASGNERISYAGIQIGLAFFLSILHGFGPSHDLEIARDRIIGILVGNVVIYLMSTLIAPVPLERRLRLDLSDALAGIAKLATATADGGRNSLSQAMAVEQALGRFRDALFLLPLEPRRLRPDDTIVQSLQQISEDTEGLNRALYASRTRSPALAARLSTLPGVILEPASAHGADRISQHQFAMRLDPRAPKPDEEIENRLRRIEMLARA